MLYCSRMRLSRLMTLVFLASFPLSAFARIPNDPLFDQQTYLNQIGAPAAWDISTGSPDVVIAVLDSGVDINHPDLAENIWTNPGEIPGNGLDDDGDGFIDDVHGWDFVNNNADVSPFLAEGWLPQAVMHGTVVAGIAAAVGDNMIGVTGITWHAKIMSVRIINPQGIGDTGNATLAIRYAVDHGARVINLSFTGDMIDTELRDEITRAYQHGVVIAAAVGNQHGGGSDLDVSPLYPACFKLPDGSDPILGVAALTDQNIKADFSNFGANCTDISAPGVNIFSTHLDEPMYADFTQPYGGDTSGTSVATPMVTGTAALLLSAYPSLTPDQIHTILQLSADPISPLDVTPIGALGAGRLNVGRALQIAGSFATSTPVPPPLPPDITPVSLPSVALSPVTGLPESVTPVSAGEYVRSPSFSTVYFVTADFHRRPFFDTTTFFTYADSFDQVKTVTDATLTTLSLGSPMLPKPGVVLVKIQSDPQTYALGDAGPDGKPTLRPIPSETEAIRVFGPAWAEYVIDVPPTLWRWFTVGIPIGPEETLPTDQMKKRVSLNGG